jgi:protein TonB
MSGIPRISRIFRTTAETGFARSCGNLRDMSNESPPGPSGPQAGGEFTWPPTSEELDAIEVIPLDGSPTVATQSLTASPVTTSPVTTSSVTTSPATTPLTPATTSRTPSLPPTLVVPPSARVVTRHQQPRPRFWLRRPSREDLVYTGLTLTSALAIAVAGTQQLSDWWRAPSQQHARTDAPIAATAPPATPSPVADVALLQLLEKGPSDVARTALAAAPSPLTALTDVATASTPPEITGANTSARRAQQVTTQPRQTVARRATYTRSAPNVPNVMPRERGARDRARASVAAAIASPPLRLPESYVQPRVLSQGSGRRRGQVVLAVQVRSNGRVGDVEVLSRHDDRRHDELERAAVSAVKQWRYRPALRDGVPAPARVKVVVNFS